MTENGRPPYPHVYQINVSDGGVPKRPVLEAVIATTGVEGTGNGISTCTAGWIGLSACISQDLIERLQDEGHSIEAGSSGENLTLAGLEWEKLKPGDRLQVGPDVQLEIMSYTTPCDQNAQWFRERDFKRISQKKNPGWSRLYAKVLREGVVRPGDEVTIEAG